MTYHLVAGSATHRGGREANQDAALATEELFAVADGLGGLEDGEIASQLALETLQAGFGAERSRAGLIAACLEANRAVWRRATADGHEPTMGTTVAAVGIIPDDQPVVVHVGDSRLYRYRSGQLDRLTEDHSITGELIRSGQLTEQEAITHPQRHILTRALGVGPDVQVDAAGFSCEMGDRLLLCTDGVFRALSHEQLEAILASPAEAQPAAEALIATAVKHQAEDNVTAVIVDVCNR